MLELGDGAEEEGALDVPGLDRVGHVERKRDGFDDRQVVHAHQEEDAGNDEAELDGDRQVEDHGQEERDEKRRLVGERHRAQAQELAPVAHVPGHEDEDGGKRAERDVARKRGGGEDHDEKRDGVDHARDGREGAGLDVRDGTGDCAGGGDAAEERNDHVGDALAHQFLIGVVAVVGHRVGHAGAQQAFNGTEHGDRDHRAEKLLGGVPLEVGDLQAREGLRNAAELGADRFDGKAEDRDDDRGEHEDDDGAGQVGEPALPLRAAHLIALGPELDDEEARKRKAEGPRIDRADVVDDRVDLAEEVGGHLGDGEAEEVLDLLQADHDRNAVREADHDRYGDELDEAADLEEAHQEEDDA